MKFNINNCVKVKLTNRGRDILTDQQEEYLSQYGFNLDFPFEDDEGWSEWQLWHLMSTFGDFMYNGCVEPFEMEIEIIEK